ncbi:MAG: DUF4123 domain-containing protein [Paracoccaceae bacterium]
MVDVRVVPSDPAPTVQDAISEEMRKVIHKGDARRAYLLIDASRSPEIRFVLEALSDDALCLFDGSAFTDLAEVAPWLVPLSPVNDGVLSWFLQDGFGKDRGLFLLAGEEPRRVKTALKRSLRVEDEDGAHLYFKYYRPSVFRTYIPQMTPEQASYILRDIAQVWLEDPDHSARLQRYAIREGTLRRVDLDLRTTG